jgi:ATP-dependent protease ClpP protease subunit
VGQRLTERPKASDRRQWYEIRNAAADDGEQPEILIYDEIDAWFGVAPADLVRDLGQIDAPEITVRINSPGGVVWDGITIYNALRDHDAKINVVVDGLAASIASVIAMAGDHVVMNRNSQMMLHNAWGICIGDSRDMQKAAERLQRHNGNIASIYAEKAGGTADEWLAVMAEETWLMADEAVAAGLADEMVEPSEKEAKSAKARASVFDLSAFKYSGREAAPAPRIPLAHNKTPQPVEAEGIKGKETTVATLSESDLQKLGLDAEADEEAISAAIDAVLAEKSRPSRSSQRWSKRRHRCQGWSGDHHDEALDALKTQAHGRRAGPRSADPRSR